MHGLVIGCGMEIKYGEGGGSALRGVDMPVEMVGSWGLEIARRRCF